MKPFNHCCASLTGPLQNNRKRKIAKDLLSENHLLEWQIKAGYTQFASSFVISATPEPNTMKKTSCPLLLCVLFIGLFACSRKTYVSSPQEQEMARHKLVAILPPEMIYSGKQPKDLTAEDIYKIEESESLAFQQALLNGILKYANSRKYFTFVDFQDISSTENMLAAHEIGIRDAWKKTDSELRQILGVDAVVRMRINKKRFMSDLASYGIDLAKQIGYEYGAGMIPGTRIGIPNISSKTNEISASCSVLSDGRTLWNDYYKANSNWNMPAEKIIESITDNFGRHFPYKQRR